MKMLYVANNMLRFNLYKPKNVFTGQMQTVQTQIRRHETLNLTRVVLSNQKLVDVRYSTIIIF